MDTHRARALSDRLLAARHAHRVAEHQLATLLTEMAEEHLHRALGYATIGEYASVVLDLEIRQARDLLRIGRRLRSLPLLDAAFAGGEIDWTKARELVRVVTPHTEAAWLLRAREVTCRKLEDDVAHAMLGDAPPTDNERVRGPVRKRVTFEMEAADAELLFQALHLARAQADVTSAEAEDGVLLAAIAKRFLHDAEPEQAPTGEPFRIVIEHCPDCGRDTSPEAEVSDTVASQARCDAEVIDMRAGPTRGFATKTIPPALRRAVLHQHVWRCAVPRCRSKLWLDVHHLVPRARGGANTEENLVPCCSIHHRAVHEGVLGLERGANGAIVVTYADGRRLVGPATHVGRATVPLRT